MEYIRKYTILLIFTGFLLFSPHKTAAQQPGFSCANEGNALLSKLTGTWNVVTKDRTSPGDYETNTGRSVITPAIEGCGIRESFRGTFKGKQYAREVNIMTKTPLTVEMTAADSEHGTFSLYKGTINGDKMTVFWYRDEKVKRLQSKYILTVSDERHFEFSSYLSTDHGATWALTHERNYSRAGADTQAGTDEKTSIQGILDAYYDCISGPIGQPRQFAWLKTLFHPEARLIYSYWDKNSGKAQLMIFTVDEFIGKLGYADKKGFYEHEVSNEIHTFGAVTQVFSTYEFRTEDKSIAGRGITSYELLFDGERYWIMSMFWTAEDDRYKVPARYLKH